MMRALLYARVSTGDQTKGTSPEAQLDRARAYAQAQGYAVVAEELDIISGSFVLARSTFNRYLEMLSDGRADVIVADIPDRLGRGDAIAQCELLAKMNGGRVEYATPGRDESTVEGIALKATDTLVSGIERLNIRRRTMAGRNAWAEKGRVIASAYRPYGYQFDKSYDPDTGRKVDCALEIVEDEAAIVRQMFEWCAYEGLSMYAIAKRLTEMGVLTTSDKDEVRTRKRGQPGQWHRSTVHDMLRNATYKGVWHYRKNVIKKIDTPDGVVTRVSPRDEDEVISIDVPAIVSEELWELAQKRLKQNAKRGSKPTKYNYLLRGMLRCGKCGGAMTAATRVSKSKKGTAVNWHYRCRLKYYYGAKSPGACDARNVPGPKVEEEAWAALYELMLDEDRLFEKIGEEQERKRAALRATRQNVAALEAQRRKQAARLERFLDLYADGELSKEKYLAKRAEVEADIATTDEGLAEARAHLDSQGVLTPEREAELRKLRAAVAVRLQHATFEQKRQLLHALQVECTYHDATGQVVMSGVFGEQPLGTVNPALEETPPTAEEGGETGSISSDTSVDSRRIRTSSTSHLCYRNDRHSPTVDISGAAS